MNTMLDKFSRLVTARPYLTLLVLFLVVVTLGAGGSLRTPLPEGGAVAQALAEIDENFGELGAGRVVTLLFRGNAITPGGLSRRQTSSAGLSPTRT